MPVRFHTNVLIILIHRWRSAFIRQIKLNTNHNEQFEISRITSVLLIFKILITQSSWSPCEYENDYSCILYDYHFVFNEVYHCLNCIQL